MATRQLIVNGKEIELSDLVPIPLTLQTNNIAELRDRQANFSNTFQVPPTKNNRKNLYFPESVNIFSAAPYRKLPAQYVENGELLIDGTAVIEGYEGGVINLTLYSGIFDFFDFLGDKALPQYDWSELDLEYTLASFIQANEDNEEITFPLIDWGAYKKGRPVDIRYQYPALKLGKIVDKIITDLGYTYEGEILSDDIYNDISITLNSSTENGEQTKEDNSCKLITRIGYENISVARRFGRIRDRNGNGTEAKPPGFMFQSLYQYKILNPGGRGAITITAGDTFYNLLNMFQWSTDQNGVSQDGSFLGDSVMITSSARFPIYYPPVVVYKSSIQQTVRFSGTINYKSFLNQGQSEDDYLSTYFILKNGTPILSSEIPYSSIDSSFNFEASISLKPGDEINIIIYTNSRIHLYQRVGASYSFVEVESINASHIGETLVINALMPDIKSKDILKSFANMFGLVFTVQNRNIIITKFNEIDEIEPDNWGKDPTSIDPTIREGKLDLTLGYSTTYRIGSYARDNWARYAEDENNQVGDASLYVDDAVLNPTNELFSVVFSGSEAYNNMIDTPDQPANGNTGIKIKSLTLVDADVYNPYETYAIGELVQFGSQVWVANISTTGHDPGTDSDWSLYQFQYELTEEFNTRIILTRPISGVTVWDAGVVYSLGDVVRYSGDTYTYLDSVPSSGSVPDASPSKFVLSSIQTWEVEYTDGVDSQSEIMSNCLMAYFVDPMQPYDLSFERLLGNYYGVLSRMLNRLKVVNCFIRLTQKDIREINFLKPKYIEYFGNKFYLNQVSQYIEGRSTQCTLIRM